MRGHIPRIHPVIQLSDEVRLLDQVRLAVSHGVDGVFLIDHDADDDRLVRSIEAVSAAHPDLFLGASVFRREPVQALALLHRGLPDGICLHALWTDDAGAGFGDPGQAAVAFTRMRERTGWHGLHFGGVAFKYQQPVPLEELPALGAAARRIADVATTSGPGTGQAADLGRLHALRQGLGDHPLALASGVTPGNVADYVGLVDHILVSTGIGDGRGGIDPGKLAGLLERVRG